MIGAELRRQHDAWTEAHARLRKGENLQVKYIPCFLPARQEPSVIKPRDWLLIGSSIKLEGAEIRIQRHTLSSSPHWMRIASEVCKKHRVTVMEMRSTRRERRLVLARQEAMWRIKDETPMSLPAIGRKFNRDHTTVLYSVRQHEARVEAGRA